MESKIEDYLTACEFLGIDPNAKPDVSKLDPSDAKYMANHFELMIINRAICKEYSVQEKLPKIWEPDYSISQYKYYPRFFVEADKQRPSGFGLSDPYCVTWYSFTRCGSRFALPTPEHVYYSAEKFKKHHTINQLIIK